MRFVGVSRAAGGGGSLRLGAMLARRVRFECVKMAMMMMNDVAALECEDKNPKTFKGGMKQTCNARRAQLLRSPCATIATPTAANLPKKEGTGYHMHLLDYPALLLRRAGDYLPWFTQEANLFTDCRLLRAAILEGRR
jgi:hypothetical protein